MATETIQGLRAFLADLKRLPGNVQRNVLRTSVFRAAKMVEAAVRERTPTKTGALRESIKARRARGSPTEVEAKVEANRFYGHFIEHGFIYKKKSRKAAGKEEKHVPARPFMGPGFDSVEDRIVDEFKRAFAVEVEKQLRKAGLIG